MNTQDRFDDQVAERLRASAPREAPTRILEEAMNRIADTPQRGSGWLGRPVVRLLAAAAVLILAVLAGAQFAGLVGPQTGNEPSPSPSVVPSESAGPSAETPSPSATTPEATGSPAAGDGLLLRVTLTGGGPTYPSDIVPWVTLMGDGTLIWQPVPSETETATLVTRMLTEEGLADLRARIFDSGLLDASAAYELEPLPDAEPPGRGVGVFTFTAGDGGDQVVITSVQWLGDDDEATYYQPAPERKELDALALELREPESMLGAEAWAGPAEPYEATDYQLVLMAERDVPPYGTVDAAELPLPLDGPLDEFGDESGDPRPPVTRCGLVGGDEALQIVTALDALGFEQVGMDRATIASLDWTEGNGRADLFLIPRMPDGYPGCEDQF